MKATELIRRLQALVDRHGDYSVGMTTVGEFTTAKVHSVRFVDGNTKGCPGIKVILISDYTS